MQSRKTRPLGWLERRLLMWRGSRRVSRLLALVLTILLAATCILALLALLGAVGFAGVDRKCNTRAGSCGVVVELLGTILVVGIAFVYLVVFRLWRAVTRGYAREAASHPDQVVQTATPMPEVVGRDDLCSVIEEDLVVDNPRPQLIVGGVGSGKTAVLVGLTRMLARAGAVPVPIHLRDPTEVLDFQALARKRFLECVDDRLAYQDEGDRIWRKLWNTGLVVILADGLDEALRDRDTHHRGRAISRAVETAARTRNMRLLIASRPDDTLTNLDAALVKLEPLSEEAAVQHICGKGGDGETGWVRRLVGVAEVVEMPFYLKLARDLSQLDRLGPLLVELAPDAPEAGGDAADPLAALDRLVGEHGNRSRLVLRLGLLDEWTACLVAAGLLPELALPPGARARALDGVREMAASSLLGGDFEFHFAGAGDRKAFLAKLEQAARNGEDLELVERIGDVVRFRHSIMQAYLGSQLVLTRLDGDWARLRDALQDEPSRELLMALVMGCYRASDDVRKLVRDQLETVALDPTSSAPVDFEMLAAAYEIDGMVGREGIEAISGNVKRIWVSNGDLPRSEGAMAPFGEAKLQEAKLRVVDQIGKVRQKLSYEALWHICEHEDSYVVRLHAAQALGTGGSEAFEVLEPQFMRARHGCEALREAQGGVTAGIGDVRLLSLQGWILPLWAATSRPDDAERVRRCLAEWTDLIPQVHLGAEACLAQGLKYEANRAPGREVDPATRPFLVGQAIRLLERGCWWYSEISLLHALCLWSLDPQFEDRREELRAPIRERAGEGNHPFVREAAGLCGKVDGDPSHSVWIDETGTVAQVGPAADVFSQDSAIGLRIPPAAGWLRLQPHAQQLLGELFLMLNLIERGSFDGRERRRRNTQFPNGTGGQPARDVLPYCLTKPTERRERFAVGDRVLDTTPGAGCPASELCRSRLCPYPGRDERPFRGELSEAFCRRQQSLLRRYRRPPAPWRYQSGRLESVARRSELRQFWRTLEQRGRI